MTKCIVKVQQSEDRGKNPLYSSAKFSKGNITVTLDAIRTDAKANVACFLFKIVVNGNDAGEFTILEEPDFNKIPYQGNIGAEIYPGFTGQGLSEDVLYLLLPFCKERGLSKLLITTNPDNEAIKKTCSNISAKYLDTLKADQDNPEKLRFILEGY